MAAEHRARKPLSELITDASKVNGIITISSTSQVNGDAIGGDPELHSCVETLKSNIALVGQVERLSTIKEPKFWDFLFINRFDHELRKQDAQHNKH